MSSYYCRLCLTSCDTEESLLFSKQISKMVEFIMPELNMALLNNPIICFNCHKSLKIISEFKTKCLNAQNDLEFLISTKGTSDESFVDSLKNLVEKRTEDKINKSHEISITPKIDDCINEVIIKTETSFTAEETVLLDTNNEPSTIISKNNSFNVNGEEDLLNLLSSSSNINKNLKNLNLNIHGNVNRNSTIIKTSTNQITTQSSVKIEDIPTNLSSIDFFDIKYRKNNCLTCNIKFSNMNSFITHMYKIHQNENDWYRCLLCRYKTGEFRYIKEHFLKIHRNCVDLRASCILCDVNLDNYGKLHRHMKRHHSNVCKNKFYCNACNFATRSYDNLRKHIFKSHDLTCNYCCKVVESAECLNRHIGYHVGKH